MSDRSNLSIWRDRYWSDISTQLLRLNTISETHFDGPLLKKDTANGAWLWSWLVTCFPKPPYPILSHPITFTTIYPNH